MNQIPHARVAKDATVFPFPSNQKALRALCGRGVKIKESKS